MLIKRSLLRGDTLVEVMFAVAIFGLVAVGAISAMNQGLYSAQTALEVTMARSEIDAQTEALRFIHSAYLADQHHTNPYYTLWTTLTGNGYTYKGGGSSNAIDSDFYASNSYNNASCSDIYNNSIAIKDKSFVINPLLLGDPSAFNNDIGKVLIKYDSSTNPLRQTSTYPRIVYTDSSGSTDEDNLSGDTSRTVFSSAEGIWVTSIAHYDGALTKPQYYDFYVRTCWDLANGNGSSIVSTTIRLYNPEAIGP